MLFLEKKYTLAAATERWPSGLRRTLGKRVYSNVSGVRIPFSLQNEIPLFTKWDFSILGQKKLF